MVSGASSGIGAAYAERLARDRYDLILVARRRERLEVLAERLRRETDTEADSFAADLTNTGALSLLESRVADESRLALVVNNAGFGGYRPFVEVEPSVIDELIGVHVRAVPHGTAGHGPARKWGSSERCIDPRTKRRAAA